LEGDSRNEFIGAFQNSSGRSEETTIHRNPESSTISSPKTEIYKYKKLPVDLYGCETLWHRKGKFQTEGVREQSSEENISMYEI
jgi:hypothetical protein